MDITQIVAYIGFATGVAGTIIGICNHTRVRSKCCGKEYEASIAIDKYGSSPRLLSGNVKEPFLLKPLETK